MPLHNMTDQVETGGQKWAQAVDKNGPEVSVAFYISKTNES